MKNKKNGNPTITTTPRPSHEITNEYTQLCAELGNKLHQFEIEKSQYFTRFLQLNQEMQAAQKVEAAREAELKKTLEERGERLVELVADEVSAK